MELKGWSYRPDIDGLRAVAIALVLVFHAASDRLPGGYIGVDTFFVISGFLITGIILRRQGQGSFSLLGFYAARVRRLYPALVTVLAATLVAGYFIATTTDFAELGRETAASAAFVANIYFWFTTDYFHQDGIYPLLHLWSLGVEEQFYLAWPLLMIAMARLGRRMLPWTVAIFAISLAYNIYLVETLPIAAFYSPFARAWELMAGAILALTGWKLPERRWSGMVPAAALVVIAASALVPSRLSVMGLTTLPAVLATMAIIASPGTVINRRLLSAGPSVFLGKISYPLYLWHWPLLAFLTMLQFGVAPPLQRGMALLVAVLLAIATWRLVEIDPVKRRTALLLVAIAAIGVIGWGIARDGLPGRAVNSDPRRAFIERFAAASQDKAMLTRETRCDFYDFNQHFAKTALPADCTATGGRPAVMVWGDSHARALSRGIRQIVPQDMAGVFLTTSACPPSMGDGPPGQSAQSVACRRATAFARETVRQLKPRVLILAQMQDVDRTDWPGLARWARLQGVGRVIVIGPPPIFYPSLPGIVARHHWNDGKAMIGEGLFQQGIAADAAVRARTGPDAGYTYVSLIERLCRDGQCLARVPGEAQDTVMASDYGHLTQEGATYVARTIVGPALQEPAR